MVEVILAGILITAAAVCLFVIAMCVPRRMPPIPTATVRECRTESPYAPFDHATTIDYDTAPTQHGEPSGDHDGGSDSGSRED